MTQNKPTVLFMVGLPGSGKSTIVKEQFSDNPKVKVISSDAFIESRAENQGITYNEAFADNIKDASILFDVVLNQCIERGQSIIIDRTNLTKASRQRIINKLSDRYTIEYMYVDIHPLEAYIRQSKRIGKNIPEPTFIKMMNQLEVPGDE